MINNIASRGVHAADFGAVRETRARKTDAAPKETGKPAHPAHPHGHIPPGLARAAEKIASKIFERADADESGSVTQEELSAVHSKHARFLASSDLFQTATVEIPAETTSETTATESTSAELPPGTAAETGTETGVTEAQLKEALTKFFYAKVGAIYAPPVAEAIETPAPAEEPLLPAVG